MVRAQVNFGVFRIIMNEQYQETDGHGNRATTEQEPNAIAEEIRRLENAVGHLERSNTELKDAITRQEDDDGEFRLAVGENIVLIAKYRARIARLKEELSKSTSNVTTDGQECQLDGDEMDILPDINNNCSISSDMNARNGSQPGQGLEGGMYL